MAYTEPEAMPLFGEDSAHVRLLDILYGVASFIATMTAVVITIIRGQTKPLHYFFGAAIVAIAIPHWLLVIWFRRGDLDPRIRYINLAMCLGLVALSVCAILYATE
ncbi:uncharacterized protein MONBRDRAFT_23856 [Monosiga brevicollis MX1]|uniref:Transmembrane protein n=1 Tax=Monosiga brevicollis TaxID=81824 RepID=A9UV15_MONBE|nr:uncharacterized protein MONBRDRAFT_23856 [Monosiga brevicollis MX1]EDQ90812.1 predicted protein [Monosiga brevicollis MX1]|eukprot:XP_001744109.1 hypothetical protein [Monosiga brevicollis MX1]